MSYKKKKIKKNIINQLKRRVGLIKIVLFKKINNLIKKEVNVQQFQTRNIMQWLRDRARAIRPNNIKINEWVDRYIDECVLNGKPVEILTQLCLSKVLEVRYKTQGNCFIPIKGERNSFLEEIPDIISCFNSKGVDVNWYITLNRSFLDGGRIDIKIENEYRKMIEFLINESKIDNLTLYNWEDELLGKRAEPNNSVQNNLAKYVSNEALRIQIIRHSSWVKDKAKMVQTDYQIEKDVALEIACEAEEGRFLLSNESPFPNGQFILMPFETAERYAFFKTLEPNFQERIVSVLKPNPWRMDASKP